MLNIATKSMNKRTLLEALTKKFKTMVTDATYEIGQLQSGTLGDVRLVTGTAEMADGHKDSYKIVWKTQQKWERYGDPNSWRREYDLYTSNLGMYFDDDLRWPECYLAKLSDNEIELWMEYVEGTTGLKMSVDMYEQASEVLGRFQGKLYASKPNDILSLSNLSEVDFAEKFYWHYRTWPEVYDYIRSVDCEIPKHLCEMLVEVDKNDEAIWKKIRNLPIVLCHRDFWVANIFCSDKGIRLIDWDTTGWGYFGEDLASLIADEADVDSMVENYSRCISAYYKGFSTQSDIAIDQSENCVRELILLMFGYRLIEWYKFADSKEEKVLHLSTLQKIYEMKNL